MKIKSVFIVLLALTTIALSACGGPKKCNGSRGTSTDMGTM